MKTMLAGLRRKYRRRPTADTQPPEQPAPRAHSAAATTAPAPGAELPSNRIVAQA